MSENLNRGIRDYSQYDTMETEELEQILRLDAEAPEGAESDTELLLYVMEVLASRRNNSNITGNTAQQAWESFQKHYMPEECLEVEFKQEPKRIATPWIRRMIAAAAIIALVVTIPITAKAFGFEDIWNVIAHWAKVTFSFINENDAGVGDPSPEREDKFYSLQELLVYSEQESNMVPTWIPDGFVLEKIEKDVSPVQEIYRAFYLNEDKALEIRIQAYIASDPGKIEINEDIVEIIESNNIEYYVFSNYEQTRAIWVTANYECYITGDVSIEDIKQMIDSITKG